MLLLKLPNVSKRAQLSYSLLLCYAKIKKTAMTAITLESGLWKKLNCGAPYNSLLDHLKSKIQNKSRLLYPQFAYATPGEFFEISIFHFFGTLWRENRDSLRKNQLICYYKMKNINKFETETLHITWKIMYGNRFQNFQTMGLN